MNWYRQIIAESHSFSTVMLEISGDLRSRIEKAIDDLDDEDIAEEGKEDNAHVTILYGLHTDSAEKVRKHLIESEPFKITLGKISKFTTSDEHDVLKIEIESKKLRDMNKKLRELPYTSSYSEYRPHLTLAYVKKGRCNDMVGSSMFDGETFQVNTVVFSSKDEEKTNISLEG